MKNIENKIKSMALATLLIGLSSWIYAESDEKQQTTTPAVAINSLEDTILFRLLQDYAFLEAAAKSLDNNAFFEIAQMRPLPGPHSPITKGRKTYWVRAADLTKIDYWSKKLLETPFSDLNQKVYAKLIELAERELSIVDYSMQKENSCTSSIENKPNLADAFMLFDGLDLLGIDFSSMSCNSITQKMQSIKSIHYNNDNALSTTNVELIKEIFDEVLENYRIFIEQNIEVLKKIELFANNGFRIKNGKQECIAYRTKEYCITTSNSITSLRQMMAYIQQLLIKEKAENE